jgi:hypothetical protein
MDVSFIVIIGLPVLYATGSIRKIVKNTGLGGRSFVLYFVCTAALSFIPVIKIVQGMRLCFAGAFFCIAPAVYLACSRRYTYKYYLAFVLTTLFSVAVSYFFNTYTVPYLPYATGLVIALAAVACFRAGAPVFAPVMMGVYDLGSGFMQLFGGMDDSVTLFGDIGLISLCLTLCLFAAYIFSRPRGKHDERSVRRALQAQDKG